MKVKAITIAILMVVSTTIVQSQEVTTKALKVVTTQAPNGGMWPQVAVDSKDVVHMVYRIPRSKNADVYYVRQKPGEKAFSEPIRVNSIPRSIAWGKLAIGKDDRVHVSMGTAGYGVYTRMNDSGTVFEEERPMDLAVAGRIYADQKGNVYIVCIAPPDPSRNFKFEESEWALYFVHSRDNGKTFSKARRVTQKELGACNCCMVGGFLDQEGTLYIGYRAAEKNVHRDSYLFISTDFGETFQEILLSNWRLNACPNGDYQFMQRDGGPFVFWKNRYQNYVAKIGMGEPKHVTVPKELKNRKDGILISNTKGEVLHVFREGWTRGKGGSVGWQLYDENFKPLKEKGFIKDGSLGEDHLTAYALPDETFVVLNVK